MPIHIFLSSLYLPLYNPINFKLSINIIGLLDEPLFVPKEYLKYLSTFSIIFPWEYDNFFPPGYCTENICSSL